MTDRRATELAAIEAHIAAHGVIKLDTVDPVDIDIALLRIERGKRKSRKGVTGPPPKGRRLFPRRLMLPENFRARLQVP